MHTSEKGSYMGWLKWLINIPSKKNQKKERNCDMEKQKWVENCLLYFIYKTCSMNLIIINYTTST